MAERKRTTKKGATKKKDDAPERTSAPDPNEYPPAHELMPERAHAEDCPVDPDRMEIYESRRPPKVDESSGQIIQAAKMVPVAHCLTCGRTRVIEEELENARAG